MDKAIIFTFYLTFAFLMIASTLTFIQTFCSNPLNVKYIMGLEATIGFIAAYFYSVFISTIHEQVNWDEMTIIRYMDWSLTTPLLLISLCIFLGHNQHIKINTFVVVSLLVLNYIMLYVGYLGEKKVLEKINACILGFIPLAAVIYIIYTTFIEKSKHLVNKIFFYIFAIIWSLYGIVYMLDEVTKNILMNVLDMIAKAFVGIGMWYYLTQK
jgi:bacteriorhodopsin